MSKKLLLNCEVEMGSELDTSYNYFVFQTSQTLGNTITLQEYRAGDETEWDGLTDWGDGTIDSLLTHTYDNYSVYTVKTKYMINKGDEKTGVTGNSKARNMLIACKNINKNITIVSGLFMNCANLKTVDLSLIDTSKSTSMYQMFNGCSSLTSLDLSHFDTSNVTNMYGVFNGCTRLSSLNISSFDTSKVTDMNSMFSSCSYLIPDVSGFDVSNVTSMRNMFSSCRVSSSDLKSWDTSKVTNMSGMFKGTRGSYFYPDHIKNWDVSSVTNMSYMFQNASISNYDIDFTSWDVSSVTNMSYMFDCGLSAQANLSGWDVSSVTNMSYMFYDNSYENLRIDISNWDISETVKTDYMFSGFYYDPDHHVNHTGVSAEDWTRMRGY